MANRKNTRKSNCATATYNDPLGEEHAPMKRIDGLFRMEKKTWAELDSFIAEQGNAVVKEYGLEEEDLDGGLGIMAWIASLCKESARKEMARVDAEIRYLDPSAA